MSNKSVSVYLEAMKRKEAEQKPIEKSEVQKPENPGSRIAKKPDGEIAETPNSQVAKAPNSRTAKRRAERRGIDIYKDQLVSLTKIQFALWRRDDRKPSIKELILTALDDYIKKMKAELGEK